jgi:hypothetical protein
MTPPSAAHVSPLTLLAAAILAVGLSQSPATAHDPDPGECIADGGHAHIHIGDGVADEDAGSITFTIACNPCGKVNANSWWTTVNGTATAPADYTAKTQMFTLGQLNTDNQTYDFVVTIHDEAVFEGNETFTVQLGGQPPEQANPSVGPPCLYLGDTTATGTINNDDPMNQPPVADAGGPYAVDEGGSAGLNGTGSSDPDSQPSPLSFAWDFDGDSLYDDATGATPTFSAAGLNGPSSVSVGLEVSDGLATDNDTATVSIANVPPAVATPSTPSPSDEGDAITASATFTDPAGAGDSPFTCTVDYGDGGGAAAGTVAGFTCTGASHAYDDDGSYTVEVCVTDKDGGGDCQSTTHVVANVPPSVDTPVAAPEPSDEGAAATVSADFSDPGADDGPFTCTIDYGVGDGAVSATVAGTTCSGSSTWGDDGGYTIEVCVTDKDGGTGCNSAVHDVANVDPDVALDTSGATSFPGGDAFLGSQGDAQSHDADGDDPGSDDLTFDWDFGFTGSAVSTVYFNDTGNPSGSADPFPSPGGTFPFAATDSASVTFSAPGLYTVRVDLTDDDGGTTFDDFPKIVTGDAGCTRSQGFWKKQLSGQGHQHVDAATLQALLDVVDFASAVFTEIEPADFSVQGSGMRIKATQQTLAAWLNFAAGAVGWTEMLDVDGDGVADTPVSAVLATIESILGDPSATQADLVTAKDLAELINLLDATNPGCTG